MQSSQRRTLLITGANKGIGYATVETLLSGSSPFDIILTSRNTTLGEQAVSTLQAKHPNSSSTLAYHQLDVNDDKSIDNIVSYFKNSNRKIDVLINNAGVAFNPDGPDLGKHVMKTNFTSVVQLTEKLIPLLAEDGKVLFVSSIMGQLGLQGATLREALTDEKLTEAKLNEIASNFRDLTKDFPPYGPITDPSYSASKAILNAYVKRFLPAKLKETQQFYSIHPGWVKTDMGGQEAPKSLEEGADTVVYLTNLPFKVDAELNGKFITERKVVDY